MTGFPLNNKISNLGWYTLRLSYHAIPLTKYAFAMIAQKPFHWTIISSETGDVDDHRTIVG